MPFRASHSAGRSNVPPFDPLTLSPSLWLRGGAPYLTEVAGPKISARLDDSGADRDFTQTSDNYRPLVAIIGGLRVADHDSRPTEDYMSSAAFLGDMLGLGQYWVAVSFRANKVDTAGGAIYNQRPLLCGNGGYWGLSVGGGLRMTHFDTGTYKNTSAIAVSTGVMHVAEGWHDATHIHCALDGVETTPVAAIGLNAGVSSIVSIMGGFGSGENFDGIINEILIVAGVTTADQRSAARAYLAAKYPDPVAPTGFGNMGNVLYVGDSITQSSEAMTGGWRKEVENLALTAGYTWEATGPLTTDSGVMAKKGHYGISGNTAANALASIRSICNIARPDRIVWGFGMNDIGNGTSAADFVSFYEQCLDQADYSAPHVQHVVQTLIYPTAGAYFANLAVYQEAQPLLAAMVAGRANATMADVGQPTTSDGYHPIDGPGGYPIMAQPILTALISTT
jgi:hypothetical protein